MKTLLVYYSFTGNNEVVARELQQRLGCDIARIETVKKRTKFSILLDLLFHRAPSIRKLDVMLNQYDRFVFMSPIWAGKIASPLRQFLRMHKNSIHRYAFITVCGGGQPTQRLKIQHELMQLLDRFPDNVAELWINDIVPAMKRNTLAVSEYRMDQDDIDSFKEELDDFVKAIEQRISLPQEN